MTIKLSDHFTYGRLVRFTLPSVIMMVFTSIYSVVDGFFVSNYVGKTPFAAINLIMPFLMLLGAVGFMFGTGGKREVRVLKNKPCKRNNRPKIDNTKSAAKQGNAEERPDAGCGIKR